jgi:hypothetical protein
VTAVTDLRTPPEPIEPAADSGRTRKMLIAVLVAIVVVLGLKVLLTLWWRRGGPRRAITGLAEDGAVKLADVVLDEVFGAA